MGNNIILHQGGSEDQRANIYEAHKRAPGKQRPTVLAVMTICYDRWEYVLDALPLSPVLRFPRCATLELRKPSDLGHCALEGSTLALLQPLPAHRQGVHRPSGCPSVLTRTCATSFQTTFQSCRTLEVPTLRP